MYDQKLPSNRSFGLLFFFVFIIIGLWPIINSESIRIWSVIISLIFFILGIFNAKILTPLNKVWMSFGKLLGNFVSPIVMGIIFFGVVTPTGLILKLFSKDILNLKKNKNDTYWLKKDNSNNNMKNQF
ncbi:SxtJ family membrane protein [Candidatus Pelagibacter sp.]|nr:SxtJ family membrane protein [Candidatus Pelagibacter sp.]|tara:strand:+ start:1087 stop:1470 length:384 start_codon:yes stop_codon:yes gene_type:complete